MNLEFGHRAASSTGLLTASHGSFDLPVVMAKEA
jgi:hypothetical protein